MKWYNFALRSAGNAERWQMQLDDFIEPAVSTGAGAVSGAFSNTWKSSTAFSANNKVGYYKDPFQRVHLRGTAERNTPVGQITNGEIIFTLPLGYRPDWPARFYCVNHTTGNGVPIQVGVNADGTITVTKGGLTYAGATSIGVSSDTRMSFDGVSFRIPSDQNDASVTRA